MADSLSPAALDQLFRDARTNHWFDGREVTDDQITAIWDLVKMAPDGRYVGALVGRQR